MSPRASRWYRKVSSGLDASFKESCVSDVELRHLRHSSMPVLKMEEVEMATPVCGTARLMNAWTCLRYGVNTGCRSAVRTIKPLSNAVRTHGTVRNE